MKRGVVVALAGAVLALALPATAQAHGLFLTPTLPVPVWLFAASAVVVVIGSFAAIGFLWPEPRLATDGWHPVMPRIGRLLTSSAVRGLCGVAGVFLLVLVIYAGSAGTQQAGDNFASVFVFIVFWVGLAPISALFGDVFRAFNPWRAIGVGLERLATAYIRPPEGGLRPLLSYPGWLGRFPAAAGLFGFAYLELVSPRTPHDVAVSAAVYTAVTLAAIFLFGVEAWCRHGEAFSVYFNLYSRISGFETRGRQLGLRRPLSALATLDRAPGTVLLLAIMIGSVSYDGGSGSAFWKKVSDQLFSRFQDVGLSLIWANRLTALYGILLFAAAAYFFYRLGIAGAKSVGAPVSGGQLALAFAPSLVPIALAYVLAHNMQLLLLGGQSIIKTISNPLGKNVDLFGTADFEPNLDLISPQAFWYLEVGVIVIGHVCAIVLAHDLALSIYERLRAAIRSQYWMLGVMVGFTVFALWLLAEASEL